MIVQSIKATLLLLTTCLLMLGVFGSVSVYAASEASRSAICDTINGVNTEVGCGDGASNVSGLVETALQILSIIAGIVAIIMIIVSGLRFITASGDPNSHKSARNSLIYAVVGLVIVVLAQTIVYFVLGKAGE